MPPRRGWRFLGLCFYKDVAPTALGSGRRRANGFNAKSPRGKDAKEKSECFAASRLCAFALKISRPEYAAPTGLEIFRSWFLQRCRADGAGKTFSTAKTQRRKGKLYLIKSDRPNRTRPSRHDTLPIINRTRCPFRGINPFCQFVVARLKSNFLFRKWLLPKVSVSRRVKQHIVSQTTHITFVDISGKIGFPLR